MKKNLILCMCLIGAMGLVLACDSADSETGDSLVGDDDVLPGDDDSSSFTDDDDNDNNDNDNDNDTFPGDDDDNDDNDNNNDDNDNDNNDNDDDACVPPGGGEWQPLQAGVAVNDFYAPLGLALGGFGGRRGFEHPMAFLLGAARGRYDRLQVKALTLDNGEDRLVIARVPLVFITDMLYALTIAEVCARTGVDLTEKLWINALHTHSGPARFLPMPFFFADAGLDKYSQPVVNAMVASLADAIVASMSRLAPAKLAIGLDADFDPDNRITNDRRCHDNPPAHKDNRLLVMRIDRADDSPLAVLVGLAMHGTLFGDSYYTSDSMGAVEYAMQDEFSEPVEVFALQTSAGDQSPNYGAGQGHHRLAVMEILGRRVAEKALAVWADLTPTAQVEFEMVAKRIPLGREEIGYQPGEFGWINPETGVWRDYRLGAFYCGDKSWPEYGSIVDCNTPETTLVDGYLLCYVPGALIPDLLHPWLATQIAAVKINEDILLLFPGELTSHLAVRAVEIAAAQLGWAPEHIHSFGYSNDNQFYLQTEETWMQGGYETTSSLWGYRFGDWLTARTVELAEQLFTPEDEDNLTGAPPAWIFSRPNERPLAPEPNEFAPRILTEPATKNERFDTVIVEWSGGFTTVDDPRVVIEHRSEMGGFAPVILPNGRVFTDQDIRTIQEYEPSPDYTELPYPALRLHRWRLAWETTVAVPTGEYRFHVSGAYWDGNQSVAYELYSSPFTIDPNRELSVSDLMIENLGAQTFRIACRGWYPPIPGSFRLLNPDYSPEVNSPIPGGSATAVVLIEGEPAEEVALEYDPTTDCLVGEFTKTQIGLTHEVVLPTASLYDAWGNCNSISTEPIPF